MAKTIRKKKKGFGKMGNNLTLIETEVFDQILERAIAYDLITEYERCVYPPNFNRSLMLRKTDFLSALVTIPIDLDEDIAEKLENL